jgi:hypothetical protein
MEQSAHLSGRLGVKRIARQSIELGNHQGRAVLMTRIDERQRYRNAPAQRRLASLDFATSSPDRSARHGATASGRGCVKTQKLRCGDRKSFC